MKMEILPALQSLKKAIKFDKTKIKVTLDEAPLERGDVDVHLLRFDLEAWRDQPKEYYCVEVPYFQPKSPQLTVNGDQRFRETIDADLHGDRVDLEIRYADQAAADSTHRLVFTYPYL